MAKKDSLKKEKEKPTNQSGDIHVGGSVSGNDIVIGHGNVINKYYQIIEKNTKQNDPEFWYLKHPYPMPPNFTGRLDERAMLTQWLDGDSENRLFILRALGGFGKSALAWQWLTHDVNPKKWKKVVFWSFYEGDSSFEHFTEETLKYLNCEFPQGKRDQIGLLLRAMKTEKILFILDGFERTLRAYSNMNAAYQGDEEPKLEENQLDCVDINAEWFLRGVCALPKLKSKVLMTSRLTPRAVLVRTTHETPLQGCRETELIAMQKADAVEFMYKQSIRGNRTEIEAACEPYGYHPLSLRLLAGRILKDFQNPGDISVAQTLKIDGDIVQQKHHVLEVSYNSLPEQEKKLLGIIACFRSPVKYQTLQSFAEIKDTLEINLNDLIERGLLQRTTRLTSNRPISIFDLHPIVRRYAYDRLTAADRRNAHKQLISYFEAVSKPEKVKVLEELTPVIELYHHTVRAGNLDEARILYRDRLDQLYYQFGSYQLIIELMQVLFVDGEDKLPHLKKEGAQAWTLNELAIAYSLRGQPRRAIPLFEMSLTIMEKEDDKINTSVPLVNVAQLQLVSGAMSDAERNLRRAIGLNKETSSEYDESCNRQELGRVLFYLGNWNESEQELSKSLEFAKKQGQIQIQGVAYLYSALRLLLMAREGMIFEPRKSNNKYLISAIDSAEYALELVDEDARIDAPTPRDYVRAHWLLGAAYRMNNEITLAEDNLSKALNLCRQINLVETEADILLDLARLRYAQGDFKDAQEKASEALVITERSGYVLQGADMNLFLAQYALEQEKDNAKAKVYAEEAKKLATCDGPPYYYKVAYEEAEAMLEKL